VIRVALVEDHASFRQALAFMVGHEADMEVAAEAGTVAEALAALPAAGELDAALVDLHLPDGHGVDVIRGLRDAAPRAAPVVLTASQDRIEAARAVEAGAAGVVHKSAPLAEIVGALRRAAAGEALVPPGELVDLLRTAARAREETAEARRAAVRLTPREREVLQALADGLGNKEIAQRLHISVDTQRTHMVNILGKLGVHSQLQALVFAVRHGLVRID
jgi:DNA-binding NarL/FixJ family response regulator